MILAAIGKANAARDVLNLDSIGGSRYRFSKHSASKTRGRMPDVYSWDGIDIIFSTPKLPTVTYRL